MNEQEIKEKLKAILKPYAKNTDVLEALADDTDLIKDLQINSARLVDIVLKIEDTFDIEVEDDELEKLSTLKSLVDLLTNKLG